MNGKWVFVAEEIDAKNLDNRDEVSVTIKMKQVQLIDAGIYSCSAAYINIYSTENFTENTTEKTFLILQFESECLSF